VDDHSRAEVRRIAQTPTKANETFVLPCSAGDETRDIPDHDGELDRHLSQRLLHTLDVRSRALHESKEMCRSTSLSETRLAR